MKLPNTLWGWIKVSAVVVGLLAASIAVLQAYPEYYYIAHRGYVQWYTDRKANDIVVTQAQVERTLHHIQIEQAEGKRETTDNDLFRAQLELKKAQEPATQEFINQQIIKLQATKERLDNQLKTLNTKVGG